MMKTFKNGYFTKIVAFGNSYSDNGEAYRISNYVMQTKYEKRDVYIKPGDELYWNNRYSNGYTSVEVMSKMLNINLQNFAIGGATTSRKNYTSWMDSFEDTGILGQVDKYIKSLNYNRADPHALHFIFPFENDYFKFVDFDLPGTIDDICKASIENFINILEKLIACGAKKFFIVSCSDLSLVPYEQMMQRTKIAQKFTCKINKQLAKIIKKLVGENNVKVLLFKHTELSSYILGSPEKFGLIQFKEACQATYPNILHVKDNPDQFYFWDEWHFSRVTHEIFGNDMYHQALSYRW